MKTICTKNGNKSIHLFNDDCSFEKRDNNIFINDENNNPILVLSNLSLYYFYEDISAPENWASGKYRYFNDRGWVSCSDWKFPYATVFETLLQKQLQLVQCLHEKSILNNDDILMLSESQTLEETILEHKRKYENIVP